MSQQKICMVGTCYRKNQARFVKSTYSDIYHTTVSVKIDKKLLRSENEFQLFSGIFTQKTNFKTFGFPTYVAYRYIFVVDGTRRYTLDKALFVAAKGRRDYWQSSVRYCT